MKYPFIFFLSMLLLTSSISFGQVNITRPNVVCANGIKVNTYSGSAYYSRTDLRIPGRGLSLDVFFTYNSISALTDLGYGFGWTFSYNMLYKKDSADIIVQNMDGLPNKYKFDPITSKFSPPSGVFETLEEFEPNKFVVKKTDGMSYFFEDASHKRLTKISDRYNNTILLTYQNGLLSSATDPSGRIINFTWNQGRLTKITDPNTSPQREWSYAYDAKGNPEKVTDPLGGVNEYRYDEQNKLISVTNKNGIPVNIEYNAAKIVKRVITCVGVKNFTYSYENLRTHVVEEVSGVNQITSYQYDTLGRITRQYGNCCGNDVSFEYDGQNNIVKKTDGNGNATLYAYDNKGNVIRETDALGQAMEYTYEPIFSKVKSMRDRNGNVTTMSYDDKGNRLQINKPLGITEKFFYDAFGQVLTAEDGNGSLTKYVYDIQGNLTEMKNAENGALRFQFDAAGNPISVTNENNQTSQFQYDMLNQRIKINDPLGFSMEFTYDPEGNVLSSKDRKGQVSSFSYDGLNRRVTQTNAAGETTALVYDEVGNLISQRTPNGNTYSITYDEMNRMVQLKSPLDEQTNYAYDAVGNVTAVVYPNGNTLKMLYDKLNRIIEVGDSEGAIGKYTYDPNSNRISDSDGNGNTVRYQYDALNRNTALTYPDGKIVSIMHDKNNNVVKTTDRKGVSIIFTYDKTNRLIRMDDPLGGVSQQQYDAMGNLLALIDPNGNMTSYSYDALRRKLSETFANGDKTSWTYDQNGNIQTLTEPNNARIQFTYDIADRLIQVGYSDGQNETFSYDKNGNMLTAVNAYSRVEMRYDADNRLISETAHGLATSFSYLTKERKRRITYPGGRVVEEIYDKRNRLATVRDPSQTNPDILVYDYDEGDRVLRKTYGNKTYSELTYNSNDMPVQLTYYLNQIVRTEYGYDANDNRMFEKNNFTPDASQLYQYDPLNRLTEYLEGTLSGGTISNPKKEQIFDLDLVGNRKSVEENGVIQPYSANKVNQYTAIGTTVLSYDANGNTLLDGFRSYTYDQKNRMVSAGGGIRYLYDALNRRIAKVIGQDTTYFLYSANRVVEERKSILGNPSVQYFYGNNLDEMFAMSKNTSFSYLHSNLIGSVVYATNTSGIMVEQYRYDPYGKVKILASDGMLRDSSAISNPYLFTGQRLDSETGLYHYKFRQYSPILGRFLQRDPLGYVDGPSLYEYAMNNPVNYNDPIGLTSDNPFQMLLDEWGRICEVKKVPVESERKKQIKRGVYWGTKYNNIAFDQGIRKGKGPCGPGRKEYFDKLEKQFDGKVTITSCDRPEDAKHKAHSPKSGLNAFDINQKKPNNTYPPLEEQKEMARILSDIMDIMCMVEQPLGTVGDKKEQTRYHPYINGIEQPPFQHKGSQAPHIHCDIRKSF
jgi:RHS repeat-associated protein